MPNSEGSYHTQLSSLIDRYVDKVYEVSKTFPKEELFGVTSQLRRSSLSVALNYVEGYARQRKQVLKSFLEIAYGSLKESKYLLEFSYRRGYLENDILSLLIADNDRIGRMLWGITSKITK